MYEQLIVSHEGQTDLVATDRESKDVRVYVDCPAGLEAGADVRVTMSTFHSSNRQWTLEDPFVEGGEGVVVLGHGLARDWTDMTRGGDGPAGGGLVGRPINQLYLCTIQVTKSLAEGTRLVFPFGVVSAPHAAIAGDLQVRVRRAGCEVFEKVGEPIPLRNAPGPLARLEGRVSASADAQGKRRMVVYATDANLNPLPKYRGSVELQVDGEVLGLPAAIEIGADGRGVIEGIEIQGDGPVRITTRDAKHGVEAQSGPVRSPGERQHYFGGIHFHTRLSVDGDREPREAYAYARDHLNLDVVAMTDHAPIGAGWQECLAVNEEFYDPGRFVTIPAWESSNAYGHANLFLRTPDVDGGTWNWKPDLSPSQVTWDKDVVMVPHHPNCGQIVEYGKHREVMGQSFYWSKYHWEFPNERARLVEIVQGRGNFEADALDDYWGIRLGEQGASVQDALARGWRLGFVAGTDNHQGHPTHNPGAYVGLTCFRATELTREAVWQAMDERFTYATSGVPIVCDYAVNGVRSGAEGALSAGEGVHFSAQLHGTAPIETVEIISGGQCVWQSRPNSWDVELDGVELPVPEGASAYYYLRLRQADGHRAWLSPVWLDRK
jgi:hypothetical protein